MPEGIEPVVSLSSIHAGASATYSTAKGSNSVGDGGPPVRSRSVLGGNKAALLEIALRAKPSTMSDPTKTGFPLARRLEDPHVATAISSAARGSQRMRLVISSG